MEEFSVNFSQICNDFQNKIAQFVSQIFQQKSEQAEPQDIIPQIKELEKKIDFLESKINHFHTTKTLEQENLPINSQMKFRTPAQIEAYKRNFSKRWKSDQNKLKNNNIVYDDIF